MTKSDSRDTPAAKSPGEIIGELFSSAGQLPISGGWGVDQESACVIERSNQFALPGVAFDPWKTIRTFVEKRIYIELIVSRDENDRCSGISWSLTTRKTIHAPDGRVYECLSYEVSAFRDADWESLKAEWEGPNGYQSPNFDHHAHLQRRNALRNVTQKEFWFDISSCYQQQLFGINLPWMLLGFGRGDITDYESQRPGMGYSVAYHGIEVPDVAATVYFYTLNESEIPDGPRSEEVIGQLQHAIGDVFQICEMQSKTCVVEGTGIVEVDGHDAWACAVLGVQEEGQADRKTLILLRGHDGRFVKIRISFGAQAELEDLAFGFAKVAFVDVLLSQQ